MRAYKRFEIIINLLFERAGQEFAALVQCFHALRTLCGNICTDLAMAGYLLGRVKIKPPEDASGAEKSDCKPVCLFFRYRLLGDFLCVRELYVFKLVTEKVVSQLMGDSKS